MLKRIMKRLKEVADAETERRRKKEFFNRLKYGQPEPPNTKPPLRTGSTGAR